MPCGLTLAKFSNETSILVSNVTIENVVNVVRLSPCQLLGTTNCTILPTDPATGLPSYDVLLPVASYNGSVDPYNLDRNPPQCRYFPYNSSIAGLSTTKCCYYGLFLNQSDCAPKPSYDALRRANAVYPPDAITITEPSLFPYDELGGTSLVDTTRCTNGLDSLGMNTTNYVLQDNGYGYVLTCCRCKNMQILNCRFIVS